MDVALKPDTDRLGLEYLPLDRLIPDPNNTRTHSKAQVRQIAKSITSFGYGVPILIDGADKSSAATAGCWPAACSRWPRSRWCG